MRKRAELLKAVSLRIVIAVQWCKKSHFQPPHHQILRCVVTEASHIRSGIQKAAQIQARHLLHAEQQVLPPASVVSGPDSSIAMHSDVG